MFCPEGYVLVEEFYAEMAKRVYAEPSKSRRSNLLKIRDEVVNFLHTCPSLSVFAMGESLANISKNVLLMDDERLYFIDRDDWTISLDLDLARFELSHRLAYLNVKDNEDLSLENVSHLLGLSKNFCRSVAKVEGWSLTFRREDMDLPSIKPAKHRVALIKEARPLIVNLKKDGMVRAEIRSVVLGQIPDLIPAWFDGAWKTESTADPELFNSKGGRPFAKQPSD